MAITILGITLVITMQLFGGALSSVSLSRHYTEAVFLARHKIEELGLDENLSEGNSEGAFDEEYEAYKWEAQIAPYELPASVKLDPEKVKAIPQVMQIKVMVSWREKGRKHKVELVTLNTGIHKTQVF